MSNVAPRRPRRPRWLRRAPGEGRQRHPPRAHADASPALRDATRTLIGASGNDVGLPDGQMGNSEVGHLNLGAGRIVYQDIVRIDKAIKDGAFFDNATLVDDDRRRQGERRHAAPVRADQPGQRARLARARLRRVRAGQAARPHARRLARVPRRARHAARVGGRLPARGRHASWRRSASASWRRRSAATTRWIATSAGTGWRSPGRCSRAARGRWSTIWPPPSSAATRRPDGKALTDEFVHAARAQGAGRQAARGHQGRRRLLLLQLPRRPRAPADAGAARGDADFPHFDRAPRPKLAAFATMTQYDAKIDVPAAFPPQSLAMILGEVLSKHGVSQLRTAETEKYAHVTYFFNGGVEQAFPGEERRLVPSNRDVATYDLAPEMSAAPVTDGVVEALEAGRPRLHPGQLRQPRHGRPHRQAEPAISAHRDHRRVHRPHRRRRRGREGDGVHHRRPRQLRDDDRSRRPASRTRRTRPTRSRSSPSADDLVGPQAAQRAGGCADVAPTDPRRTGDPRSRRRWTAGACSRAGGEHRQAAHRSRARRAELAARPGGGAATTTTTTTASRRSRDGGRVRGDVRRRSWRRRSSAGAGRARRSRRTARRQAGRAAAHAAPDDRAAAAHGRGRRRDPQGLRRAGGPGRLRLRDRAQVVPPPDAQVPPRPARRHAREQRAATDLTQRLTEAYKTLEKHLRR